MREIARGVADGLGFKLVDEEIILRAAAGAGVEPAVVSDAERRRSFMSRMLDGLGIGRHEHVRRPGRNGRHPGASERGAPRADPQRDRGDR